MYYVLYLCVLVGLETRKRSDACGVPTDLHGLVLVERWLHVVPLDAFVAVDREILPRLVPHATVRRPLQNPVAGPRRNTEFDDD